MTKECIASETFGYLKQQLQRKGDYNYGKMGCTVCGYIYEGDQAPEECPVCHVGADKFKKVEGRAYTCCRA